MSTPSETMVRFALGAHLGRDPRTFLASDELTHDLGLDRLDLVMVALRCEQTACIDDFPFTLLDEVRTVGELVVLIGSWLESASVWDEMDAMRDTLVDPIAPQTMV